MGEDTPTAADENGEKLAQVDVVDFSSFDFADLNGDGVPEMLAEVTEYSSR